MKVQIRHSVFETNSSSTHALSIYDKKEWEDFAKGNGLYMYGMLGSILTVEECREQYEEDCKGWREEQPTDEGLENWIHDETYDYEYISTEYDLLEKEVPDSSYVAVSIEGYD